MKHILLLAVLTLSVAGAYVHLNNQQFCFNIPTELTQKVNMILM